MRIPTWQNDDSLRSEFPKGKLEDWKTSLNSALLAGAARYYEQGWFRVRTHPELVRSALATDEWVPVSVEDGVEWSFASGGTYRDNALQIDYLLGEDDVPLLWVHPRDISEEPWDYSAKVRQVRSDLIYVQPTMGGEPFAVSDLTEVRGDAVPKEAEEFYGSILEIVAVGSTVEAKVGGQWVEIDILSQVYCIPDEKMAAFEKKFAKMVKKAAALDAPPPSFQVLSTFYQDERFPREVEIGMPERWGVRHQVVVFGQGPVLNGWEFIGTLDPGDGTLAEGLFLVKMVPGHPIPEGYQYANLQNIDPLACHHCNKRRRRNKTMLVQHEETGEVLQVGSACIKDFTGHPNPNMIAQYLQWLDDPMEGLRDEDEMGEGGYGHGSDLRSMLRVLAGAHASIKDVGFVSASKSRDTGEMSTAQFIGDMTMFSSSAKLQDEQAQFWRTVDESDEKAALAALAWAPTLWTGSRMSDYGQNMRVALSSAFPDPSQGKVSRRTMGLVVSLISVWLRTQSDDRRQAAEAKAGAKSEHIGQPGDRVPVRMTVVMVKPIETMYGSSNLIKAVTDEGNHLTWFYSGDQKFEEGERYGGTCGIKKHGVFRDVKETTVQRCTLRQLDRVYVKLTKKQASVVVGLGVLDVLAWTSERGWDREVLDDWVREAMEEEGVQPYIRVEGVMLVVEPEGMSRLAEILPELPKAIQKKILAGVDESDLEM